LKEGLEYCISNGITELQVFGDSKLVIEQMKGNWKMKKGLYLPFAEATKELVGEYTKIDFEWIRREENTTADALSNRDIPTEIREQAKINFSKPKRRGRSWKAAKTKKNWLK
jgi:probable phosphoglycerate mutase